MVNVLQYMPTALYVFNLIFIFHYQKGVPMGFLHVNVYTHVPNYVLIKSGFLWEFLHVMYIPYSMFSYMYRYQKRVPMGFLHVNVCTYTVTLFFPLDINRACLCIFLAHLILTQRVMWLGIVITLSPSRSSYINFYILIIFSNTTGLMGTKSIF
jgi:hypothetical protein